jgi:hypothetical protein
MAGYTYTCHLDRRFSRSVGSLTVLQNAVRPANHSAHRPVGEPVGHHSTANQMSGLQATHRTFGAPAIRTEIASADSAAPLPLIIENYDRLPKNIVRNENLTEDS